MLGVTAPRYKMPWLSCGNLHQGWHKRLSALSNFSNVELPTIFELKVQRAGFALVSLCSTEPSSADKRRQYHLSVLGRLLMLMLHHLNKHLRYAMAGFMCDLLQSYMLSNVRIVSYKSCSFIGSFWNAITYRNTEGHKQISCISLLALHLLFSIQLYAQRCLLPSSPTLSLPESRFGTFWKSEKYGALVIAWLLATLLPPGPHVSLVSMLVSFKKKGISF